MTNQQTNEQFQTFAQAIGDFLKGWKYRRPQEEHPQHNAYFDGPNGATFFLHLDTYRGKIETRPNWPKHNGRYMSARDWTGMHNQSEPSCGFTMKRTASAVARDIARRFIPEFVELFSKVQDRQAQWKQEESNTLETATRLADILGTEARRHDGQSIVSFPDEFDGYGDITVPDGGNVTLNIRAVPVELAETLTRAIADYHKAKGGA